VMAIEQNNAIVNFHVDGSVQRIILSYPYHNLATTPEDLKDLIIEEIIRSKDYRVEHNRSMFLKRLAARSGLGRYGRNNIFYVNGLGSFLSIYTFFTDYDFKKEENWHEVKMLNECTNCHICFNNCPTKAISRDDFVIDVEKCLSLYNEIQGIIPDWIDSSAHNSLMGCTKCQVLCPANKLVVDKFIKLEDITKEESKMILNGEQDEELAASIGKKLHMFDAKYAYYFIPIIKRNLELLLK
ncbi:MAG: hypothetical protein FK734_15960, partial [Asgard group archaeon]|nr:hypothetical protein [Asgard group archaeon]